MSWFKRRKPTPEPKAIKVELIGLELRKNHECIMIATYNDGNTYELGARVHENEIKKTWSVQGLDANGHSVVCDIIEDK